MENGGGAGAPMAPGRTCAWCGKRLCLEAGEPDLTMQRELAALRTALDRLIAEEEDPTKVAMAAARIVTSISATLKAARVLERQAIEVERVATFRELLAELDEEDEGQTAIASVSDDWWSGDEV
jgi:hypothetical protein